MYTNWEEKNFSEEKKFFDNRCKELNIHNWLEDYKNQLLPEDIPKNTINWFSHERFYPISGVSTYSIRALAIMYCGFCLVTKKLADVLASYLKEKSNKPNPRVLELGCGLGSLAKALSDRGIDIQGIDNFEREGTFHFKENSWIDDIIEMDMKEAVITYGKTADFILCSWPEMEGHIDQIPKLMYQVNPSCKMVYLGEDIGGCTANDRFFNVVNEIDSMQSVNDVYCRWEGIHDYWSLLQWDCEGERDYDNKRRACNPYPIWVE